jgi:DNA-binding transcriptional ArsR family regulator
VRELSHPAREELALAEIMHALSDPVRLEIVRQLCDDQVHSCTALADTVDVHKSTMSHHYRVLREAGVTHTTVDGRSRFTRLRREDLDSRFPGLLDSVTHALRQSARP